ncbi:aspartate racemase [Methylobacterium sp. Leaf104]|uniref:aspartate/glutamate racemase family protein n=1 Tax=Methylobacterium TaxID=407 RepID=UPI0006F41111|nr:MULTISPECIES: amino acid racemase [Methylobacterium]KQP42594.1 aspartate racemase [Methylobacterium sp. Leaf104]MCI9878852.1 aspartate/glutamate racemase family protein [Methylobacterium goesingense]
MLGVLGGMGPMATVDFMGKVVRNTPAACDQDHIEMVVCSAANIPDRTAAILGEGTDPLPAMRDALRRLEAAGATRIAVPCNTAHHWHTALQAETSVPVLHIVDAVAETLAGEAGCRVGVLATDGTIRAGIYGTRLAERGFACQVPNATGQAEVMRAIRLVKAGYPMEARTILRTQAEALIAAGCNRVVMACTEIPVALASVEGPLGDALLDATDALAQACVRVCMADAQVPALAIAA